MEDKVLFCKEAIVPYLIKRLAYVEKYRGTIFFFFESFVDFMNNSMTLLDC
jgi:hypothetical protein